mmetsp:Transcript_30118/g.36574  ORF Transcript_30118/g.36574 Transcript_30118/m.36574 type:complete len:431 (-) Transcript_30118:189-1481(-)|eukprot:CAMPEP_0197846660 /NCGR_PEP_ID=MMETSP1438-20131217/3992_1 /TAXON_ID=1461541 /ORGANISM="Pterosperma sp., Strain CCMP1384" /LENGTH=430 /DNA_ID=CAMNT_0043458381 /DNA_START=151 /DNA_END=1443 /DNA_ORIENTATION=-
MISIHESSVARAHNKRFIGNVPRAGATQNLSNTFRCPVIPPKAKKSTRRHVIHFQRTGTRLASTTPRLDKGFVCEGSNAGRGSSAESSSKRGATRQAIGASSGVPATSVPLGVQLKALLRLARPTTLPQAVALVFAGAWGVTGNLMACITNQQVLLFVVLTFMVNAVSMIVNDYYDMKSGVDAVNYNSDHVDDRAAGGQKKVLQEFEDGSWVKQALHWIYGSLLILTCFVSNLPLRLIVMGSTVTSYVYTSYLKPVTGLKNVIVAVIVALAVGGGAVAAYGGAAGLKVVSAPMMYMFLGVLYREVMMDINDMKGDRAAGVQTLPVKLGRPRALLISQCLLGAMTVIALLSPIACLLLPPQFVPANLQMTTARAVGHAIFNLVMCYPMWREVRKVAVSKKFIYADVNEAVSVTERGPMALCILSLLSMCHA